MEYVRIDENFCDHPKVLAIHRTIRPAAGWLYLRALCYAAKLESDGYVPAGICESDSDDEAAEALCDAGLWHEIDGGFTIHDFLDWNRSKSQIAEIREKRREAGSRGGKQTASNLPSKPEASCLAKSNPETKTKTEKNKNCSRLPGPDRADLSEIAAAVEKATGNLLSSVDSATVAGWCRSFDRERILAGIAKAVGKGKTRIAYIGTIIAEEPVTPTPKGKQSSDADEVYEWGDPRG